jgi:hypothetical protein
LVPNKVGGGHSHVWGSSNGEHETKAEDTRQNCSQKMSVSTYSMIVLTLTQKLLPKYPTLLKVKFTVQQATKAQRGRRGIALLIHDFGARRGWVVSTMPQPLYAHERPGTHCTGGWVGTRASLDMCEKSRPHQDSIPRLSSPYQVTIPTELSRP